ncbi:Hypothetical predicted protein [Drosophila guanche]|uniref:Gustatory receptor n=1 Tax=Drosophila guanche TaxID=7266 RepID=A0A3B0KHW9_DROGU|nr:Hypothetical predicted protein [Drosophila guanche]
MRDALHDLLLYQRRLGITTIDDNGNGNGSGNGKYFKLRPNWITFSLFWLLHAFIVVTFSVFIVFWDHNFEVTHTGAANHFAHVTEVLEPLSMSWLLVWMRLHEDRLVRLLNRLKAMASECHKVVTLPRWLHRFWLIFSVCIFIECCLYAYTFSNFDLINLMPLGTFWLRHMYYNYLVSFFTAIICAMEQILMAQRHCIERSLSSVNEKELLRSLFAIDEILVLCELDMNYIFGVSLALQMLYTVLSMASMGYMFSLQLYELWEIGAFMLFIFPTMFYAAMPSWSSSLQVEFKRLSIVSLNPRPKRSPIYPSLLASISIAVQSIVGCFAMQMKLQDLVDILRFMGLTNLRWDKRLGNFRASNSLTFRVIRCLIQGLLIWNISSVFADWHNKGSSTYSLTDEYVTGLLELAEPVTLLLQFLWMIVMQDTQMSHLMEVQRLSRALHTCSPLLPSWLPISWLIVCMFCVLPSLYLQILWFQVVELNALLHLATYFIYKVICNFVKTFYLALVYRMFRILSCSRGELAKALPKQNNKCLRRTVSHHLKLHDDILLLCERDLSVVYGVPFCLYTIYDILEGSLLLFDLWTNEIRGCTFVIYVNCILFIVFYASMPFWYNKLNEEVSKL